MSAQRKYPRKAEIQRLVRAAREAGIDVGGFEVSPEGVIRILPAAAMVKPATAFDEWADRL